MAQLKLGTSVGGYDAWHEALSKTLDPTKLPTSNTDTLLNVLSQFANRIKAITGKANWFDDPDVNLANVVRISGSTMTGPLALSGAPSAANHAANKDYVDQQLAIAISGLDPKPSCRVATTANITLSARQTIDGVTLNTSDRVLVKDQTNAAQNGIYVVNDSAWARALDADNTPNAEVTSGMYVWVDEGTGQRDSGWYLTTDGTIVLGTTPLTFVQFSGAGQIIAGTGIIKNGNTLSVDTGTTANKIVQRDGSGNVPGSITGDAATLGGKVPGTAAGNIAYFDPTTGGLVIPGPLTLKSGQRVDDAETHRIMNY